MHKAVAESREQAAKKVEELAKKTAECERGVMRGCEEKCISGNCKLLDVKLEDSLLKKINRGY